MDSLRLFTQRIRTFIEANQVFSVSVLCAAIILGLCIQVFFWQAPSAFPFQAIHTVGKGDTLSQIAEDLERERIIRSPLFFKGLVVLLGRSNGVRAGDYFFEKPVSVFNVARRLSHAEYGLVPVKVTIPEGFSNSDIALYLKKQLQKFDDKEFLAIAQEGYLFPDTYFFLPNSTAHDVISLMEENFNEKISQITSDIAAFKKPLHDIVTMASILEEEARTTETRRILSGILWKRIAMGMPLQVDVTFQYINGKNTYELTQDDLDINSPYNTYKVKGLPPGPISNPGLDALEAAVRPTETSYLYFLSDRQGNMYYAKDFEEHKKNRILYLNN